MKATRAPAVLVALAILIALAALSACSGGKAAALSRWSRVATGSSAT